MLQRRRLICRTIHLPIARQKLKENWLKIVATIPATFLAAPARGCKEAMETLVGDKPPRETPSKDPYRAVKGAPRPPPRPPESCQLRGSAAANRKDSPPEGLSFFRNRKTNVMNFVHELDATWRVGRRFRHGKIEVTTDKDAVDFFKVGRLGKANLECARSDYNNPSYRLELILEPETTKRTKKQESYHDPPDDSDDGIQILNDNEQWLQEAIKKKTIQADISLKEPCREWSSDRP
jgi:hypothetical protein